MKRIFLTLFFAAIASTAALFSEDMPKREQATFTPYTPETATIDYPDTLTPVFINHVGRHGSHFLDKGSFTFLLHETLIEADTIGTITPAGKKLLTAIESAARAIDGHWGELNPTGTAEQAAIAKRLCKSFPELFDSASIEAESLALPRCVASMNAFTMNLLAMSHTLDITTHTGPAEQPTLAFDESDEHYKAFLTDSTTQTVYNRFLADSVSIEPILRIVGEEFPLDYDIAYDLALSEYYFMAAIGIGNPSPYFTPQEYRQMWAVANFSQYLRYSASTVSGIPASMAAPLLQEIIATADSVVTGKKDIRAKFRFTDERTLMSLLAMLQVPDAYYLTNYFDTVADNWKDYEMFPMSANLQLIFFKADKSGEIYVLPLYNEKPINLMPSQHMDYIKWNDLRTRFLELIPLM